MAGGCGSPTDAPEPGRLEAAWQRLVANRVLSPLYRRYVEEMGLRGDERVLDYGSGAGAAAGVSIASPNRRSLGRFALRSPSR